MTASGPTRSQEIEVKLAAAQNFTLPDLSGVRGVGGMSEPIAYDLDALYYDTQALDLLHNRLTLRRRTGGKDAGWHLKLPGSGPGTSWSGSSGRTEVSFPLSDELPAEIVRVLRGVTRDEALQPVAAIRTRRTVTNLLDDGGTALAEVADDQVRTEVVGEPGRSVEASGETSWRELEVELLSGAEDIVRLAAGKLTKAGARPASGPSKLGAALAAGGRGSVRGSNPLDLHRRSRAVDVVLGFLAAHRDALVAADLGLRLGVSQSLHASRSALRRLRGALLAFRPLFREEPVDQLLRNLKSMDKVLQPVRDNDVLLSRLTGEIAEEPVEFAQPAEVLLQRAIADRNAQAWESVNQWLQRQQPIRVIRRLDALVAEPKLSEQQGSAARLLPALVAAGWTRTRKLADVALSSTADTAALERVRRAVKSVRYAAEAAGTALGDDPVVFAAALEEVQEVLGEHRNAVLMGEFLVALAADVRTSGRAGFLYGRLHAAAGASVLHAADDFTDAWHRANEPELSHWLG